METSARKHPRKPRHAFSMFDGVEFDIRLTADGQLIVHHDRTVSVPEEHLRGHPKWMEEWALDDLTGSASSSMLSSMTPPCSRPGEMRVDGMHRDQTPHPKSAVGGGFLGRTPQQTHRQGHALADKPSTSAAFHATTRCSTPFIVACPLLLTSLQPTVLGRRSSPTSRPTVTRTSQRLQVLPNFSPRPLPAWSNNTEHRERHAALRH